MMTWQDYVRRQAQELGLSETSGRRSLEEQRRLGGSSTSFHLRGTREQPGALDIGGPAEQLRILFRRIRDAFRGRIEELYLNVPGGSSVAIKDNQYLGTNPEAGRPRHLHVAIGGNATVAPFINRPIDPGMGKLRTGEAIARASSECERRICPPDFAGMIRRAVGEEPEPQSNCLCWSDVWVYGASLTIILIGAWMLFLGREKSPV